MEALTGKMQRGYISFHPMHRHSWYNYRRKIFQGEERTPMKFTIDRKNFFRSLLLLSVLLLPVLSACGGSGQSTDAAAAIEAYNQALVAKDANRLANLSCAAWEAEAKNELDSFGAVSARLEGPSCQINGKDGEYTLVSCTGKIIADYNGENLEINLGDRTYKAINEGGDWRMCGYR
jgi:hypothetical protein